MAERKTKTSAAVKDRWNKQNYEVIRAAAIPKAKGLQFKDLVKRNNDSVSKIVERAIDEYIKESKGDLKMKKFDGYIMRGLTEEDNKAIMDCAGREIEMTIDENGFIYDEAERWIAEGVEVEPGNGIYC